MTCTAASRLDARTIIRNPGQHDAQTVLSACKFMETHGQTALDQTTARDLRIAVEEHSAQSPTASACERTSMQRTAA